MKRKTFRKTLASLVAAACAVSSLTVTSFVNATTNLTVEFEDGELNTTGRVFDGEDREGNAVAASGNKFIFLQDAGETVSVDVTVESAGMYNLSVATYTPYGSKQHSILINDKNVGKLALSENKTGFVDTDLGNYKLEAGKNTIKIVSEWGWTYLDKLTVSDASFPELKATKSLVDSKATDEAKRLMCYLADTYGNHIISGQQEIYKYGPHDFEYEFEWLKENTGDYPVVRGFDFLNCANILYGSEDGTVDRMIDWAKNKNGIATASWHVTVPKKFADYEQGVTNVDWSNATYDPKETDFDTAEVIKEGTKENKYYMACLEALAAQLKKLQDANVPFIFRPLHEAEGGGGETASWFWWGKAGSAVYKELWKLTYTTLTEKYDLHNIIWEWNSYAFDTSADWYPGDEYVDIVGYDKYNCTDWSTGSPVLQHNDSAISAIFYNISEKYDGKKMVAMAENDNVPTLGNLTSEKAAWLYFCTWYDGGSDNINFLTNPVFNVKEDLVELYQSDYCITMSEVPADLYNTYSLEGFEGTVIPEPTTQPPTEPLTTTTTSTEETTTTTITSSEEITSATTVTTTTVTTTSIERDLALTLDYDKSTMTVGETREIKFSGIPSVPVENVQFFYSEDSLEISYEEGSDVVTVTALKEGEAYITILASEYALGGTAYLTVAGEGTEPQNPTGTTEVTGTPTLIGDVNLDGDLSLADVILLSKNLTSPVVFPINEQAAANADVCKDLVVDSKDLSLLIEYHLGGVDISELG